MANRQYDNDEFFAQYLKMDRSKGLPFAGEWHLLKNLFPPFEGKEVLDLGCGLGWHSKYASDSGAKYVLGIDSSRKMLSRARNINSAPNIEYSECSIEEYEYPIAAWDIAISNLALHYVEDLNFIFKSVYSTLKEGGEFIFNIEHPVFTSGLRQEWIYDKDGNILYWPIDNYFLSGKRETIFLGKKVVKYHHTLTEILNGAISAGFSIRQIEEVYPSEDMLLKPGMKDELRRPMMLLVKAVK